MCVLLILATRALSWKRLCLPHLGWRKNLWVSKQVSHFHTTGTQPALWKHVLSAIFLQAATKCATIHSIPKKDRMQAPVFTAFHRWTSSSAQCEASGILRLVRFANMQHTMPKVAVANRHHCAWSVAERPKRRRWVSYTASHRAQSSPHFVLCFT